MDTIITTKFTPLSEKELAYHTPVLPEFPRFKKLELKDRYILETFIRKHPPYSDFNFVSLFSWNTNGNTQISQLHGNLVIAMKDYTSNKTIYSFLGNRDVEGTIDRLLAHANQNNEAELRLIPETNLIDHPHLFSKYQISEDRNQFDYVYNLKDIVAMKGRVFSHKRTKYNKFKKENDFEVRQIDINNPDDQAQMLSVFSTWIHTKDEDCVDAEDELAALKNCMALPHTEAFRSYGLFINGKMEGFSTTEVLEPDFAVGHFQKTNHKYKGMTEYLMVYTAEQHLKTGQNYLNGQQDLGIIGMRNSKSTWNPHSYLKKYRIQYQQSRPQ